MMFYAFIILIISSANCNQLISLSLKCIDEYNSEMVLMHNKLRSNHIDTPSLIENKTLSSIAMSFSDYLAKNDLFEHSRQQSLGENLANIWSPHLIDTQDCKKFSYQFVEMWYDEIKHYKYHEPVFSSDTGHFTQMIWKTTEQLGCGLSITKDNRVYGVCNYYPQGNVIDIGYFESNVLPLKQFATPFKINKFLYLFSLILISVLI